MMLVTRNHIFCFFQNAKEYILKAELPGMKKSDVKVTFNDGVLKIDAEKKEEKKSEDETKHYSEFSYGKIERAIRVSRYLIVRHRVSVTHAYNSHVCIWG